MPALLCQFKDESRLKCDFWWFNSFLNSLLTDDYYHIVRQVEVFGSLRHKSSVVGGSSWSDCLCCSADITSNPGAPVQNPETDKLHFSFSPCHLLHLYLLKALAVSRCSGSCPYTALKLLFWGISVVSHLPEEQKLVKAAKAY